MALLSTRAAHAVEVRFTADNAYAFGYGTASGITNLLGGVENCQSADIFSCGTGPEAYTGVPSTNGNYLYIVAYCDGGTTQGVLGQFINGTSSVLTGVGPWEVYSTGVATRPNCGGAANTPTLATINGYITTANSTSGGAGTSIGWTSQVASAGRVGVLWSGENNAAGGSFPLTCTTGANGISTDAHWMWYKPNPNVATDPFTDAAARNLLIFRLPVSAVTNPTAYYVNKDIKNTSGVTANGVEITVAGHHTYNDIFHAATPIFTVTSSGADDKLQWTGGNVAPGTIVHVGFRTNDASVQIKGIAMIDNAKNLLGCGRQLNTNLHTNALLTWKNDVTACTLSPSPALFVGNISFEYFANEVPLGDLNATAVRSPILTSTINLPPTSIVVGGMASVQVPAAPSGANWLVIHQSVGTDGALSDTQDWIQVPLSKSPAPHLGLYNTGVDNNLLPLGGGLSDPHYKLTLSNDTRAPAGNPANTVLTPVLASWVAASADSAWIAPLADQSQIASMTGVGTTASGNYEYSTIFTWDGIPGTIFGQWATDNDGVSISVNGTPVGPWTTPLADFNWHPFAIELSAPLVVGVNSITFRVHNQPGSASVGDFTATGLRVRFTSATLNVPAIAGPGSLALLVGLMAMGGWLAAVRRRKGRTRREVGGPS